MAVLPIPQPYDFVASTDRFRAYGRDLATAWVDGALYRVVDGTEVHVERAVTEVTTASHGSDGSGGR